MTHVVTSPCIKCKYTDCAYVCPVSCFYESEDMLVINPKECIDCGVCVSECPVGAIVPDTEPEATPQWMLFNKVMSEKYQTRVITEKKEAHPDSESYKNVASKEKVLNKDDQRLFHSCGREDSSL